MTAKTFEYFSASSTRAPAALDRSADRDDAGHAGFVRATQIRHRRSGAKSGIIEMGVGFDEHER